MSDDVSVVIPTLNAGAAFESVLAAVRSQEGVGSVDLVVVDSESCDDTVRLAQAFGARCFRVERARFEHGHTRNLGAAVSTGRDIAFLTQDAEPANSHWLASLRDALRSESAAGAYSRVLPRPDSTLLVERGVVGDLVYRTEREVKRTDADALAAMEPFARRVFVHFNNVSSMVDRERFAACPFPHIAFGEDLAWGERMLSRGEALVYEPASEVLHAHPSHLAEDHRRHAQDAHLMRTLFGFRNRDGWKDSFAAWREQVGLDRAFRQGRDAPWTEAWYGLLLRAAQISGQWRGSYRSAIDPPRFQDRLPDPTSELQPLTPDS